MLLSHLEREIRRRLRADVIKFIIRSLAAEHPKVVQLERLRYELLSLGRDNPQTERIFQLALALLQRLKIVSVVESALAIDLESPYISLSATRPPKLRALKGNLRNQVVAHESALDLSGAATKLDLRAPAIPVSPTRKPIRALMREPDRENKENLEYTSVMVYYASLRRRKADFRANCIDYDDSGRIANTEYGFAKVSFPRGRKRGTFARPFFREEDVSSDVVWLSANVLELFDMIQSLKNSNEGDVAVFVHGAMTQHRIALMRAAQIKLDTGFRGAMVAFSWPSRGPVLGYVADLSVADTSARKLAEYIELLQQNLPNARVHVIGHSLGAYIITKAIAECGHSRVSEVILAAPDISYINWCELAQALVCRSDRTTVYVSNKDQALFASKALSQFIGRVGQLVENAFQPGIEVIDATRVASKNFFGHQYVFEAKLANDVGLILDRKAQIRANLELAQKPRFGDYYRFKKT